MITISLCMIVKNEEDVLARCLASVAGMVDEIIVVDTGSTDKTKAVAAAFTHNIYDFEWIDDFSAARNYAFSLSRCDYAMWLDADDVIKPEDAQLFLAMKQTLSPAVCVVMMPYHTGFDPQGNLSFSYYRERLIRNHRGMAWVGAVHEVVPPVGEIFYASCAVQHQKLHPSDPQRNLRIFQRQLELGHPLDPRQQFYYGRELYYHQRYREALAVFEAFLEREDGWLENRLDALCHCAYCHQLLGEPSRAVQALLHTFALDLPRAEICCELGKHFFEREQWRQSAFWYTIATTCHKDEARGGFIAPDCYGYLPCIQLCVCYSRLGELEKAVRLNELAAAFKPQSQAVAYNRDYFAKLASGQQE